MPNSAVALTSTPTPRAPSLRSLASTWLHSGKLATIRTRRRHRGSLMHGHGRRS